jgi:hypothetical protein
VALRFLEKFACECLVGRKTYFIVAKSFEVVLRFLGKFVFKCLVGSQTYFILAKYYLMKIILCNTFISGIQKEIFSFIAM